MRYALEMPAEAVSQDTGQRFVLEMPKQEPATLTDRVMASPPGRFLRGASSVIDGGAEMLPKALGTLSSGFGMMPNAVSDYFNDESRRVRKINKDNEDAYQQARQRTGQEGTDYIRGAGDLASGVVLGMGAPAMPAGALARAGYGAAMGGASAAFAPTRQVDDKKFGEEKAAQTGMAALAGGVMTPAIGAVTDRLGPVLDKIVNVVRGGPKTSDAALMARIEFQLRRDGMDLDSFPEAARRTMISEVRAALKSGNELDGAAVLRKMDMDRFGGGTQGQITRDPNQWNREFTLRQVEGAGEPLVAQALRVRQATGQVLDQMGAAAPGTPYTAGGTIAAGLRGVDDSMNARVNQLYEGARNSQGRYAPLNTAQFSKLANDALDEGQRGYLLPDKARKLLNAISEGDVPLNVNTATQLESTFATMARDAGRRGEKGEAGAINQILKALRNTDMIDEGNAGNLLVRPGADAAAGNNAAREAFNAAKKTAASRFRVHEAVPAMRAAMDGDVAPERFVEQFIVGKGGDASIDNVQRLFKVMPEEGRQAAREQVIQFLNGKAFGSNVTADGPMAVASYNNALRSLGREKLNAIFPSEVVDDLYRIGRVNSYVTQQPAGITPARSGTVGGIAKLISAGKGAAMGLNTLRGAIDVTAANRALSPNIPSNPVAVVSPTISDLLRGVPIAGGIAGGFLPSGQ